MKQKLFAGPLSSAGESLSMENKKIAAMTRTDNAVLVELVGGKYTEIPFHMIRQIDYEKKTKK